MMSFRSRIRVGVFVGLAFLAGAGVTAGTSHDPDGSRFVTEDLDRFWQAWDRAAEAGNEADRARAFFELYYLPASPGLRDFIGNRVYSVFHLLAAIDAHPRYYASLRRHTGKAKEFEEPTRRAFRRLAEIYPDAVFPDVYIVIGRLNSGGTTSERALLIGAEMYGLYPDTPTEELDDWLATVLKPMDGLPHIIAHESIHYQQKLPDDPSLLAAAIREGSADFLAEMISGSHVNGHVHEWAAPRARALWVEFEARMDRADYEGWLYGGDREDGGPQDLGYWIGYEITKAFYERAEDKVRAVREILEIDDFHAFLDASGYAARVEPKPE